MSSEARPSPEALLGFMQNEWADLHHSRVQEWTALGVVAGIHFGLAQGVTLVPGAGETLSLGVLVVTAALVGAAFSLLGLLITLRHRHLMNVKLNWIFQAEEQLGLIKDDQNPRGIVPREDGPTVARPWRGFSPPRMFSTNGLIVGFYALLMVVDFLAIGFVVLS